MNNFSNEEMLERYNNLAKAVETRKKDAKKILDEIESLCKEMIAVSEMIKSRNENVQNSD